MASTCSLQQHGRVPASINLHHKQQRSCSPRISVMVGNRNVMLLQGFIYSNNVSKRRPAAGLVGYYFLDLSARGLGDPETTLTKVHPVCPAHLGKQPIARWYFPPEVDFRLEHLPPNAKGLVVWIIEAKVLSKAELQFLALLPTLRPNVRVVAECGNWRKFVWKPLKEIAGLTAEGA
ncbi:NAD(P)H-quinone oxidoreductase subunit N [Populus alba x Populus x berolinensis]|uniref:NAD(P)H-quinone oxidoreductase subunit N n=1 Tax=Populus alba x Populus x berolinensis TaxID=444605 RepID=A0AAD6LZE4_9ROSI|nr:NAD(P)H-quinone oxidoreductase subunit N [Populus alba x Populus x berolinensis]